MNSLGFLLGLFDSQGTTLEIYKCLKKNHRSFFPCLLLKMYHVLFAADIESQVSLSTNQFIYPDVELKAIYMEVVSVSKSECSNDKIFLKCE